MKKKNKSNTYKAGNRNKTAAAKAFATKCSGKSSMSMSGKAMRTPRQSMM